MSYVKQSPFLYKLLKPVAGAYAHAAGYRQMGLRYEDLITEENQQMQKVCTPLAGRLHTTPTACIRTC